MSQKDKGTGQLLSSISREVHERFVANKRVLSFAEYVALVRSDSLRHLRTAAQYLKDVFDYYDTEQVPHPTGEIKRFKLFDAPWAGGDGRLIGQEEVQNSIYRALNNFVRQGRVDRLLLLHGPNGSSKSTITDLIASAMEQYSSAAEGALYKFNWIFPRLEIARAGIGFGGEVHTEAPRDSYAHLDDTSVDARLPCDLKDHPLLLLPEPQRNILIDQLIEAAGEAGEKFVVSNYLRHGDLSYKNKQIYEALLGAYEGDYSRVLRHVQIERFYISRRYGIGTSRIEPQMAVDARIRQLTSDRSLTALPTALQSMNLFELDGPLAKANRGLLDYADLLKRPLETFKYLLSAVEDSRVALDNANLFFDVVFVGSVNELHLNAFMESPEWMSFRGRLELIRVPYLLDFRSERKIYEDQLSKAQVGKCISPHATAVAALWAVLTRLRKPDPSRYPEEVAGLVEKLTPREKATLYAERIIPSHLNGDAAKHLRAAIDSIYRETTTAVVYEGRTGASPREIRSALSNAGQEDFPCLTSEAVLRELGKLVRETSVYDFLRQEASGGYFDHKAFLEVARDWYLDLADEQFQTAMGLVEETSYLDLFTRYVQHVTHAVRQEQVVNPVTGLGEDPDEKLMADVERLLEVADDSGEFRQGIMSRIGAWSIDHPGEKPEYAAIFPGYFQRLRERYFAQQFRRVRKRLQMAVDWFSGDRSKLSDDEIKQIEEMVAKLKSDYGYCDACSREVLMTLLRHRYSS